MAKFGLAGWPRRGLADSCGGGAWRSACAGFGRMAAPGLAYGLRRVWRLAVPGMRIAAAELGG